jgi:hypothetical protein
MVVCQADNIDTGELESGDCFLWYDETHSFVWRRYGIGQRTFQIDSFVPMH